MPINWMLYPRSRSARRLFEWLSVRSKVSAQVHGDIGKKVADLGSRLQAARDAGDLQTCREVIEKAQAATMAGVVTTRMKAVFGV